VTHPSATLVVVRKQETRRLVDIFDAYPLRAKKARDYAIWREAVLHWAATPRRYEGRRGGPVYDWGPIPELREALIAGRAYHEPYLERVAPTLDRSADL
jgi:hypothetical protein